MESGIGSMLTAAAFGGAAYVGDCSGCGRMLKETDRWSECANPECGKLTCPKCDPACCQYQRQETEEARAEE